MNNKFKKNIVATSISAVLLSTTFNVMAIDCSPDAPLGSLCDAIIANDGKGVSLSSDLYVTEGNGLTYTGSNSFVPQYLRKN
ncbi:autotransporter outer membrane beta-barrel domain-containing protein, partial [Yersinia ruckeri]|nr:autotransporter outer membrane beta-barrel domain-containing protein [Yersinia ruckeri]